MGTDDMAVTDPLSMKVHGLDGLRVVDASVFPFITNGNIYAPVMMTAEKAADLILGQHADPARRRSSSTATSAARPTTARRPVQASAPHGAPLRG